MKGINTSINKTRGDNKANISNGDKSSVFDASMIDASQEMSVAATWGMNITPIPSRMEIQNPISSANAINNP